MTSRSKRLGQEGKQMQQSNLHNKIIRELLIGVGLVAFLQVGNTYAFLNDGEVVEDNIFATGSLQVDLRNVTPAETGSTVSPSNSVMKYFEVENTGNEEFKYSLGITNLTPDNDLCGELDLETFLVPTVGDPILKYDGKLKDFVANADGTDPDLYMALG